MTQAVTKSVLAV